MTDYIDLESLAREFNLPTSDLLREAQDIIDRRFQDGGIAAITGLSTGTRLKGQVSIATVSSGLAKLLRDSHS